MFKNFDKNIEEYFSSLSGQSLNVFPLKKMTVAVVTALNSVLLYRYRFSDVHKDQQFLFLFRESGCMLKIWLLAETANQTCFDSADLLWSSAQILKLPFPGGFFLQKCSRCCCKCKVYLAVVWCMLVMPP